MTAPRLIAVDIGNTSVKLGWFNAATDAPRESPFPQLLATHIFSTGDVPSSEVAAALPKEPCRWRIVSVHRQATQQITDWVRNHRPTDEVRSLIHRDLPIDVRVDFPDRVGLDRLAAAVAANWLRDKGRPAIVVTAGSAITVNLITGDGAFAGGVILPGFHMAARALASGTDLLPLALLAPEAEPPPVIGKNTEAAIKSGLFWGAAGAVREIIHLMTRQLDSPPQVFVTGGDLRQLAQHLGNDAAFVPNLVLCGVAIANCQH
jgi:type III pantothenate kinase